MTDTVKGKITHIWKGVVKENAEYGPSAEFKITIEGAQYKTFCNLKNKSEPFKVGDDVEFQWKFSEKFGTNDIVNNKTDGYTFKNLTNPSVTEKKAGSTFKPDPEREMRMVKQAALQSAALMCGKVSSELNDEAADQALFARAQKYVAWIYGPKAVEKAPEISAPKQESPPVTAYQDQDGDIPF